MQQYQLGRRDNPQQPWHACTCPQQAVCYACQHVVRRLGICRRQVHCLQGLANRELTLAVVRCGAATRLEQGAEAAHEVAHALRLLQVGRLPFCLQT